MKTEAAEIRWALPELLEVPPDNLSYRVDVFEESILLHKFGQNGTDTKLVSASDIAHALTQDIRLHSGVLPEGALWWSMGPEGEEVALWRSPRVWKVALLMEAFQPPRRFTLPMPGLVFVCSPGRPPRVYAAKRRPASPAWPLFHAPLFNLFQGGRSCPGTHKYPDRVEEAPESFFQSFFTREGHVGGRSRRHPDNLLALWEELDGKKSYPIRDLVPLGTVEQVMGTSNSERR
jgi:PRTRC genetic system protein B